MNIQSPNEIQTIDSLSKTIEDFKIVELFRSCQEKFDETNKILRDENERLSKSNSDLYTQVSSLYDIDWQKNSKITELTKIISMKDNYISKIHTEINKKIKVWDEKEKTLKCKIKERESILITELAKVQKNVDEYKSTDDSLIVELKHLRNVNKDLEYCLQTIRIDHKKESDIKNKVIEKMNKTLTDIQNETNEITSNFENNTAELTEKIKVLEESNKKYIDELEGNQHDLKILNEELGSCKAQIEELQNNFDEFKIRLEYKDCVIENMKDQNLELLTELNKLKVDQEDHVDYQSKAEVLSNQVKDLEQEKNEIICQYELTKLNFSSFEKKLQEYETVIEIYKQMEVEFNNLKEVKKQLDLKRKEDSLKAKTELNNVKKEIIKRDEQIQNLRNKFMTLIQELSLKLMENQSFYKNLLDEFTFVKENMNQTRNNMLNNAGTTNTPVVRNKFITDEDRNNKINEYLKQIISKLNNKINEKLNYTNLDKSSEVY